MSRKIEGELPVGFRYTPGVANTSFFEALRDRGVLLGSRCEACAVTYVPARMFCERCFAELTPGVECGPGGSLESFTIGHVGIDGEALDEPVVIALLRLDRADTVVLHRLLDVESPVIGMRVTARLRPQAERSASILDIEGFERE